MNLFEAAAQSHQSQHAPLADRMRPQNLDNYVGQEKIIGKGRLLRRAIEADQLSSIIFYGPPGTGKTTLARIIARTTQAEFITINAVLAGVKDIRESIAQAQEIVAYHSRKTILFVDEVHRFNKAQQDALLPHVENGTIILIGATTENPYFEVNKALVSRSRIFELHLLTPDELSTIIDQVLHDPVRGYGAQTILIDNDARRHLCTTANGDARSLLNALELAVETTTPLADGTIHITQEIAEESIQKRAVLYDKDGDAHYDIISAFIKSIRGSDPDAALFWLAKMLYAGEDPRFIFRRMIICASEDIGLADPQALPIVLAAAQSYDYIGMPEGRFPLSQACIYLATAPKSNSTLALFDALRAIEEASKEEEVPNALKDSSRDKEGLGHGEGYLYPHAYRDHWVAQQYLPSSLQGKVFYTPSDQGYEKEVKERVELRRELQILALQEQDEHATFQWKGGTNGSWSKQTSSEELAYYEQVRQDLFSLAHLQKDSLVLDLNCGSGVNTLEAIRQASDGGVWSIVEPSLLEVVEHQIAHLSPLERPQLLKGPFSSVESLKSHIEEGVSFTHIIGRNIAYSSFLVDKEALAMLLDLLASSGIVVFSLYDALKSSRLSSFLPNSPASKVLQQAEESLVGLPISQKLDQLEHFCSSLGYSFSTQQRQYRIVRSFTFTQIKDALSLASPLGKALKESHADIVSDLSTTLVQKESVWSQVVHFVRIEKSLDS